MINKVILIGRLGQSPDVTTLESGATVAKFSVATDENYKDREGNWQKKTEWSNILAWRNLAEKVQEQAKKGTLVYVEGKLTTRSYVKNDEKRYVTEVVANYVRILKDGIPREGYMPSEDDAPGEYGIVENKKQATAAVGAAAGAGEGGEASDDLPF